MSGDGPTPPRAQHRRRRRRSERAGGWKLPHAYSGDIRPAQEGPLFTPIHEALLRLACLGYVTTNYDVCLLEARQRVYPTLPTHRGSTRYDSDTLNRWFTRDIFDEVRYPVLLAHGIYDRGDTIVLGLDDYRAAYAPGSIVR